VRYVDDALESFEERRSWLEIWAVLSWRLPSKLDLLGRSHSCTIRVNVDRGMEPCYNGQAVSITFVEASICVAVMVWTAASLIKGCRAVCDRAKCRGW